MASALLTKAVVQKAIELAMPTIEALIKSDLLHRNNFYIGVADRMTPIYPPDGYGIEDAIVFESRINPTLWKNDYQTIGRSKLEISHRTGLSTVGIDPAWLQHGDTRWGGSVV